MQNIKSILLIDNDPDDQEFFIDSLHSISSTTGCYAVSSGEEALHALLEEKLNPDFIFMDLNITGISGLKFLQTLRATEALRNIPVVILSETTDEQKRQASLLGVKAFYSKSRPVMLPKILTKYVGESVSQVPIS